MLGIKIICFGKLREKHWKDAAAEYAKRLSPLCKLEAVELPEVRLPDKPSKSQIEAALNEESKKARTKIKNNDYIISLCVEGMSPSSQDLAERFLTLGVSGKSEIVFLIGSSYGLAKDIKEASDYKLSLSKLTFPHQMARVILMEQIYRAFKINEAGKYHK